MQKNPNQQAKKKERTIKEAVKEEVVDSRNRKIRNFSQKRR